MPFDFACITAPFRMQPGLRRMATGAVQLTPNRPGDAALAAKLVALRDHAEQVLCAVGDFDSGPALNAICAQAARDCPEALQIGADGSMRAPLIACALLGGPGAAAVAFDPAGADAVAPSGRRLDRRQLQCRPEGPALRDMEDCTGALQATGVTGAERCELLDCLRALPPSQRRVGLLCLAFAEDFAVIDGTTGCIPWLAVCLPSHWAPEDKVGRHFTEVHAPVADNALLLKAAAPLTQLVCGPDRWERFVWTLTPSSALDAHPWRRPARAWPPVCSGAELAAAAWLRTEHQSFIPVPGTGQAVFVIQVEMHRLIDLADSRDGPAQSAALGAALASMSPAVLDYRGLTPVRDRLLRWLAAAAAGGDRGGEWGRQIGDAPRRESNGTPESETSDASGRGPGDSRRSETGAG